MKARRTYVADSAASSRAASVPDNPAVGVLPAHRERMLTGTSRRHAPRPKRMRRSVPSLALNDQADFDAVNRGFVAKDDPLVVKTKDGRVIWDVSAYAFVDGEAPPSVNPSLWRQAKLNNAYGLFKVTDGIYQVRGYDISNMSVIESPNGRILVDPLTSTETAAAALALVNRALGERPIVAVIFTHSHVDHFGGVASVVDPEAVRSGKTQIVAPAGFMKEALSENVLAGPVMGRRAQYMYGNNLSRDARGHVDTGLGKGPAVGGLSIIAPTITIDHTGQELDIDGVHFVFQYVPDSEAPAELTFFLPRFQAFCGAEIVSHTMHNLYTLRGAKVRDAAKWAGYIDRGDRPVRSGYRSRLQQPPLARLGQRAGARLHEEAARHVCVHPRPDAASRIDGTHAAADRRDDQAAAKPRTNVRRSRLLRHAEAQRESRVSVLLRLVRRQSGEPRSAAAAGTRQAVCRRDRRPSESVGGCASRVRFR